MAKYILGVKEVGYASPAEDGGIATVFGKKVQPVNESVTFEDEEGEITKHFLQGARYPFLTIHSAAGTTFKFALPVTNENLKQWVGGEIAGEQWKAPRDNYQTEQSLELMTEFGIPIYIARATCFGVCKFGSKTTDLSRIEVTAIVELPTKASEAPMVIGVKAAQPAQQNA